VAISESPPHNLAGFSNPGSRIGLYLNQARMEGFPDTIFSFLFAFSPSRVVAIKSLLAKLNDHSAHAVFQPAGAVS
jgi:hypothetical protein